MLFAGQQGAETFSTGTDPTPNPNYGNEYNPANDTAGQILMGYRLYNPTSARFLTRDPAGYGGGVNLYAYCRNNPVGHLDPMGLTQGLKTVADGLTEAQKAAQVAIARLNVAAPEVIEGATVVTRTAVGVETGVASRGLMALGVGGRVLSRVAGPVSAALFVRDVYNSTRYYADQFLSFLKDSPEEELADQPSGSFRLIGTRRKFTSPDKYVGQVANAIERRYPGLVVAVNTKLGGHEIDILLKNAIIEVKSGGSGLEKQIKARRVLGLPVIGYSPKLGRFAIKDVNAAGGIGTNSIRTLLSIIKP